MFYQIASLITTALAISEVTFAAPSSNKALASPNLQICTEINSTGCVTIPISSNACINLRGGLSFLNDAVSSATVPDGFVCTFFDQFECLSAQNGEDIAGLQSGTWNFNSVPGIAGPMDFNDRTSSITCVPV